MEDTTSMDDATMTILEGIIIIIVSIIAVYADGVWKERKPK